MNLLGIYTVGVARSLCRRLLLDSNRKLSIVMALSTTFYAIRPWNYQTITISPFKVTDFGSNRKLKCDFLLVINTDLPLVLVCTVSEIQHSKCQKSLRLNPSTEGFPWDDLRKIFNWWHGWPRYQKAKKLSKISTGWVGRTNVTGRRQSRTDRSTERRYHTANANVNVSEFTFAIFHVR